MPFEVADIIRRQELAGTIGRAEGEQAHADLLDLDVELWPHEAVARAAWGHRHDLSIYDASYVGLADTPGTSLVTLDTRVGRAPGVRCTIGTPPARSPVKDRPSGTERDRSTREASGAVRQTG